MWNQATNIKHQLNKKRGGLYSLATVLSSCGIAMQSPKTTLTLDNNLDINKLAPENIYHINDIKKICIDFRLRFLDARYFKAPIPQKTQLKIKALEQLHHTKITNYKIVAPAKMLQLEDPDDPVLFASLGNDYYYFIDKWGNDLHWFRKWLVLPVKTPVHLLVFTLLLSALLTYIFPMKLFTKSVEFSNYIILFLFKFKMIISLFVFYGAAFGKNFNNVVWNSRFSKN